jgi:pimeloyl-ACP methyl ester carboxylesterase
VKLARVVWISPSGDPERSAALVARELSSSAVIAPKPLEVWTGELGDDYGMATEVAAVDRFARDLGWPRFHLVGFSAGASVALAAALALGSAVLSVAVIEPATIGDDDWSEGEAAWRARMDDVFALPAAIQQDAFRRTVAHPDEPPPAEPSTPPESVARGVALWTQALRETGLVSDDWKALTQQLLVVTGGRSHPRFAELSDRLLAVAPNAEAALFEGRSHLSSPHRNEPGRMSELLLELWSRAAG